MVIGSKEEKALRNALGKSKNEDRVVVYMGVAHVVAQKVATMLATGGVSGKPELNIIVRDLVYEVNEIVLVDKVMLEKYIFSAINFRNGVSKQYEFVEAFYTAQTFEEAIRVHSHFSKEDIALVNNNMAIFKQACVSMNDIIDMLRTFDRD